MRIPPPDGLRSVSAAAPQEGEHRAAIQEEQETAGPALWAHVLIDISTQHVPRNLVAAGSPRRRRELFLCYLKPPTSSPNGELSSEVSKAGDDGTQPLVRHPIEIRE
jgi:hypothetical protein